MASWLRNESAMGTKRRTSKTILLLCVAVLLTATAAWADVQSLGVLSFDNVIPGSPGSAGQNQFTVLNLTGNSGVFIPGVIDSLTFQSASLALTDSSGTSIVSLPDISATNSQATPLFVDTDLFTLAVFQATLSQTQFKLDNGSIFQASSNVLSATLLPSSGPDLVAGVDFALINVSGTVLPPAVPEPTTLMLLALGSPFLLRKYSNPRPRS